MIVDCVEIKIDSGYEYFGPAIQVLKDLLKDRFKSV